VPKSSHIAGRLRDYADLLTSQGEGGFRSRAYRRAADVVAGLDRPVELRNFDVAYFLSFASLRMYL